MINTGAHNRSQLWGLIKDIKFGMFMTRHKNGHLHSQTMTMRNQIVDEDDRLWTTTANGWFSGGVDYPELALIDVRILHARYWDMKVIMPSCARTSRDPIGGSWLPPQTRQCQPR